MKRRQNFEEGDDKVLMECRAKLPEPTHVQTDRVFVMQPIIHATFSVQGFEFTPPTIRDFNQVSFTKRLAFLGEAQFWAWQCDVDGKVYF